MRRNGVSIRGHAVPSYERRGCFSPTRRQEDKEEQMRRETKAGLVVSYTFLWLVGVVLFSKLKEQQTNGTESPDAREAGVMPEEPRPILSGIPTAPPGNAAGYAVVRAGEQQK